MKMRFDVSRRGFGRLMGACLAAGALTLAASAVPQDAQAQQVGGTLKLAFGHDAGDFDPAKAAYGMSHAVIEQVFSGLTALDADANPYPDVAESIDISDDGLVYTFHLRKGVNFHDGTPFTAEDVKFTFDRLKDPETGYPYAVQLASLEETTVIDDHTVQMRLSVPTGPFLVNLAFPGSAIVSKSMVESGHDLGATPVGTGPFKFVSYQPGTMTKFVRNPDYYEGDKPYFEAMEYRTIADETAITNALLSGVVDFSNAIAAKDWATVEANPDLTKVPIEGGRWFWVGVNNNAEPLNDAKVRQAIAAVLFRPGESKWRRRVDEETVAQSCR